MAGIDVQEFLWLIDAALREDVGSGDVTTSSLIPPSARAHAVMRAREAGVACGLPLARAVFERLSPDVSITLEPVEGLKVSPDQVLLRVAGPAGAILTAERTALNFVQRLSGIATLTSQYVHAVAGTRARILDTRKTTPGWRRLEKYAVACGGGQNHREGLFDMILIKDNHLAALKGLESQPIRHAIRQARGKRPGLKVEVEVDTRKQLVEALEAEPDVILLDNMTVSQLTEAVKEVRGRCLTEASGGINLANVREVAGSGVDLISIGALTHSARALDVGLDFEFAP